MFEKTPILSESGPYAHSFLFIAGVVLLSMFLIYCYWCQHQRSIDLDGYWGDILKKTGLSRQQIKDLTHDDDVWYYQGRNTCVAYSESYNSTCPPQESYCAGGETYGTAEQQAMAIKEALDGGGEHMMCPLVYPGTA